MLIGENGAGKSTLMKIIAGIEQESSGQLYMDNQQVTFKNVTDARQHGIGIIHQELSLFLTLMYIKISSWRGKEPNIKSDWIMRNICVLPGAYWISWNTPSILVRL